MGMMISPGPCRSHCGSGVSVGANVNVGRGVSDDGRVGVYVGKKIGVTVAASVGEGDGGAVEVGTIVGVGETTRPNPPHAMREIVRVESQTKGFLAIISSRRFDDASGSAQRESNFTVDDSDPRECAVLRG
jgi:hypothetical protein